MFCEYAREMPELDEQIQAIMDYYEGKMLSYRDFVDVSNERFYNNGRNREAGIFTKLSLDVHIYDIITDSGKRYQLEFCINVVSQDAEKSVGLDYVKIEDCDIKTADYDTKIGFVKVDALAYVNGEIRKRLAGNE
jgi:hypothetical protein